MSRLIVKGLPTYITPDRLKEYFSQSKGPGGIITDVKVAHKQDGTSRRFGFVGYKTDAEAAKAKEWFDKTFLDTARVRVDVVDGAKDAPAPRPNKRPRLGPSPSETASEAALGPKTNAKKGSKSKDSQLDEFLQVMQPKSRKGPSWADAPEAPAHTATQSKKSDHQAKSDVEKSQPVEEEPPEGMSDMEWLRARMRQDVETAVPEKAFEQSDDEEMDTGEVPVPDQKEEERPDPTKETILQTARLFVRNLAFACTEDELRELFRPFGEISQIHIPIDPKTKQPKGLAYVSFTAPTAALAAYETLDRKSFQGRLLHILGAVDRKGNIAVEDADGKKKSLKDERGEKKKATAGKEFNWSMLYMNSDAVLSSVADRMNLSKSDILDPESPNAAVKLALAETHVISETKAYLESQGVILSSFSDSSSTPTTRTSRSDTTILVKNIPYGTTADQIREMFETHGELSRVLVPPAGTMAVVEFVHPDEARKAFRAVAYRRLGNSVIYLEKGPVGMFQEPAEPAQGTKVADGVKPVTVEDDATVGAIRISAVEDEPSMAAGSTLFVKNLAFSTTAERLNQVFKHLPSFAFARIQTKPDPKRPNARLSMGYGFVGFKTIEGAKKALKGMQGYVLDGHALSVKFAGRGVEEDEAAGGEGGKKGGKSRTTKMLVKNVPFEATKKEIRELFGSHGQLKSVRVPKRFDHRTRGFAFLEFVTRQEAENAYNALKHTHLLGRHLVLEWAEEGDMDVEELRKKAGVGFGEGKELPGRKRKIVIGGDEDGGVEDAEA